MPVVITVGNQTFFTAKTGFDDAATEILNICAEAEHASLKSAGEIAHVLSSGDTPTRVLATSVADGGLGHPYGHGKEGSLGPRGPIPNGGDAGIINIQTGEFAAGWDESYGYFIGDVMANVLFNETNHAELLDKTLSGNEIQVPRTIEDAIEHRLEPIRQANLNLAKQEIDKL